MQALTSVTMALIGGTSFFGLGAESTTPEKMVKEATENKTKFIALAAIGTVGGLIASFVLPMGAAITGMIAGAAAGSITHLLSGKIDATKSVFALATVVATIAALYLPLLAILKPSLVGLGACLLYTQCNSEPDAAELLQEGLPAAKQMA